MILAWEAGVIIVSLRPLEEVNYRKLRSHYSLINELNAALNHKLKARYLSMR